MRLMILCTPRTGNTWLRHLLADAMQAPHQPYQTIEEVPWSNLPDRCVYAMHWLRDPALEMKLADHNFRIVVPLRHPLDVLISILQNAATNPGWVQDPDGADRPIHCAMPSSAVFAEYATGTRARILLTISPYWANCSLASRVRYEDLVADPLQSLRDLLASLGAEPRADLQEVVARNQMPEMRNRTDQFHCWRGSPGVWRQLLPADTVKRVSEPFREIYEPFGYTFDADPTLTLLVAERRWIELACSEWADSLQRFQRMQMEWRGMKQMTAALDEERKILSVHCEKVTAELDAMRRGRWRIGSQSLQYSGLVGRLNASGIAGQQVVRAAKAVRGALRFVRQLPRVLLAPPR